MPNLSVYLDVQDDEQDEGDETMDDEVEVDEIIFNIEGFKTKRSCLYFQCEAYSFIFTSIIVTFFHSLITGGGYV